MTENLGSFRHCYDRRRSAISNSYQPDQPCVHMENDWSTIAVEQFHGETCDEKVAIFSAAVITIQLAFGVKAQELHKQIMYGEHNVRSDLNIRRVNYLCALRKAAALEAEKHDHEARHILNLILEFMMCHREERADATQILEHLQTIAEELKMEESVEQAGDELISELRRLEMKAIEEMGGGKGRRTKRRRNVSEDVEHEDVEDVEFGVSKPAKKRAKKRHGSKY